MTSLDVAQVRAQYPAFEHPETAAWAFFENAGGAYVPRQVSDRLLRFFTEHKVQPYGPSPMQREAGRAMDAGYATIAAMINANPDEITLGPSTTMNLYVLAQAMRPGLESGDEIIVTNQDHEANIGCWRRLEEFGVIIREWRINPETGELAIQDLERLAGDRTRAVCFSLCSNIIGSMNDVAGVCRVARAVGAVTIADGVSFAPHCLPDVQTLGVDFFLFSTYKTFATHLGVLWARPERLNALPAQGHYFNADKPRYRLNPTGPLHAEIGALAGLDDYIRTLYAHHFPASPNSSLREQTRAMFALFAAHETTLANKVLDFARGHPRVRVLGQAQAEAHHRAGTIALKTSAAPSRVAERLADAEIAVGAGHFYAVRCLEALNIDPAIGVLRISLVHYNSAEEVTRLLEALKHALGTFQ